MPRDHATCPICQTAFTRGPRQATQRYCSDSCRKTAWRRRNRRQHHQPHRQPTDEPPTTIRDCPHCGHPIAIVALLVTPQAARPQLPLASPEVIPIRGR